MPDKPLRPMLPQRHQPNLFSVDVSSISLKDARQQMEFPFFALSKKPDLSVLRYEDRNGNSLEITPSVKGLPTIYDKDFLIYAVSLVMERLNRGEPASRRLRLYAADMLEFANRSAGGRDYKLLDDAITRLRGCTVRTNIQAGDIYKTSIFGLIESGDLVRRYGWGGRLQYVEITLSEWLWGAIEARQVLTLHPDYFRLRRPIERRVYEVARKFCGRQAEWQCSLSILHEKCGSKGALRRFRQTIRRLAGEGDLLDYSAAYDGTRDTVIFRRLEGSMVERKSTAPVSGETDAALSDSVAAEARRRHGPDTDLRAAERDWRSWLNRKGLRPTNPAAMFLSFLETWAARRKDAAGAGPADGDKPDWIQGMADGWWAALAEEERQAWREHVGERVELDDGEGWFRSEKSLARLAFETEWPPGELPPAGRPLPRELLLHAAAEAGLEDPDFAALQRGWRARIERQPVMHDRWRASFVSYVKNRAAGPD